MLSKHLTHLACLLSVCEKSDLIPGSPAGEGLTPSLSPCQASVQAGRKRCLSWEKGRIGKICQQIISSSFLIEFVIKEVVRGGEETESELILDGGREQLN